MTSATAPASATPIPTELPDDRQLQELEEKFDPEMRFRPTVPPATTLIKWLLIALSCFHYYTAGFGLLQEVTHRGVHLAFVLGMIFLLFAGTARRAATPAKNAWLSPGGVPLVDWLLAAAVALSVLYIPYVYDDIAFRVGNPSRTDVVAGTILFKVLAPKGSLWVGNGVQNLAAGIVLLPIAFTIHFDLPLLEQLLGRHCARFHSAWSPLRVIRPRPS